MRFYWAIVLAVIFSESELVFSTPISWPTASSRVGQDIYEACDSDMYIAEFLHPEHSYGCISTGARIFSPEPVDIGGTSGSSEAIAMCSDEVLLICICGSGLGYCPSKYRVARYYVCSNPFEYPNTEPVEEAYDGPYAALIASSLPYDCSKPSDETKTDPSGGDSYGDGGTGGDGGDSGTGDDGTGDTGPDDDLPDDTSPDNSSVEPSDYDCENSSTDSSTASAAYSQCQSYMNTVSFPQSVSSGYSSFDGTGIYRTCGADSGTCDCYNSSCNWSGNLYYGNCVATCYEPSSGGCYKIFKTFPFGEFQNCSLSIPKPDGQSYWTENWQVPVGEGDCQTTCQEHRDNYSQQYPSENPDSGSTGPTDYEDCEASPDCNWVGAPMGFGVCHCDSDSDTPSGDEGTGPTSRSGRSGSEGGSGKCGKGPNGASCESTQQNVLAQVSELGENFENFSKNFKTFTKVPADGGQTDLNTLGSQFENEINSSEFSESILNDSGFIAWKTKFLEHIQAIKTEASQLAESIVVEPPVTTNVPYGCLEFDFYSHHFGPECVSEHIQPALPYLSAFLDFLKYLIGFFILFRERN